MTGMPSPTIIRRKGDQRSSFFALFVSGLNPENGKFSRLYHLVPETVPDDQAEILSVT